MPATGLQARLGPAQWLPVVCVLLALAVTGVSNAETVELAVEGAAPAQSGEASPDDASRLEEPWEFGKTVDTWHASISSRVERSARRIDSFFADDRFYADATKSYARLSVQSTWENGEDTESEARVRARIDLPGTRQRLRLFVEGGEPDEGEGTASDSITEALDDNDYNVGLEAQLRNTGRWDLRPGLGVKASNSPDPFVRLRAVRYEHLDSWLMRFSAGVAEFVDDGTEVQSRVDFDRKINPDWLFRSTSRARYRDSKDRIDFLQQLTVFQKINSRLGLAYDIGVRADDDPDWEVDHYFGQLRARVRAYKKWLFVELKPQVVFREEDDYDPSYLFSLRMDAVFGQDYR
ncbi:MAG: hypothetical protein ACR2QU_06250 [Gammaproteobacteria bacterium]